MADLIMGLGALALGILLIVAGVKGMRRNKEPHRNPDGLTRDEFIKKHSATPHLAEICWYFGIQPDELKEEIEILLSKRSIFNANLVRWNCVGNMLEVMTWQTGRRL